MAEELLRRNLDRAFDPGADFPNRLLLSRTVAMLDADAATAGRGKRRERSRLGWPLPPMRLVAIVMALVVAVAATAAFLALHRFFAPVPVHTPPFKVAAPGVGVCFGACFTRDALFVSPTVGLLIESTTAPCDTTPCPPQTSVLFRTDDGGLHWKVQHSWKPNDQIGSLIASPDARELLIIGGQFGTRTSLLYSADEGITWKDRALPPGTGQAVESGCKGGVCSQVNLQPEIYFLNPREGWVLSQEQSFNVADLFHTTDSGAHWVLVASIDIKAQFNLDLVTGITFSSGFVDHSGPGRLMFQNSSTAWIILGNSFVGNLASSSPLFRSLDGGVTWQLQRIQSPPGIDPSDSVLWTVKFFNDRDGVLELKQTMLESYHYVYTTSDGGDHWSGPIQVANVTQLVALFYIDVTHWVGLPIGGGWMRTADAGRHWDVTPATTQFGGGPASGAGLPAQMMLGWPPPWFSFSTPSQGWAYVLVQPNGAQSAGITLYETTDGGVDWTPLSLPELE
jgi:photosystem II stability/assembly factor-like uncharacterized protein